MSPTFKLVLDLRPDGWHINIQQGESIFPATIKPNALAAARRILQMLDLKEPVHPQNWPERVCIDLDAADDQEAK